MKVREKIEELEEFTRTEEFKEEVENRNIRRILRDALDFTLGAIDNTSARKLDEGLAHFDKVELKKELKRVENEIERAETKGD